MEFRDRQPIYLQISDFLMEKILGGEWKPGDRIPSVRDWAVEMEVNPNTVSRTYQMLQDLGIIENRRGVGYYVAPDALAASRAQALEKVVGEELPPLFRKLAALGITPGDLAEKYGRFLEGDMK